MSAKIKTNDEVIVLTGRDKGKTGKVVKVLPNDHRAIVSGINIVTKHKRATQNEAGGIIKQEATIHISNLSLIDPKDGKATRVLFKTEDGKKFRVAKRSGTTIN